jgi:hypothetical protein
LNRSERATLDRIQQELEKALWSLRQFMDEIDAALEAEDKVNSRLEQAERSTNAKPRD